MNQSRVMCSVLAGDTPPAEFRIFPAGKFSTTKGDFTFDATSAELVMAAYAAQGVDYMVDLEHFALGDMLRPDAPDARGWFRLAMRNGELWAVGCKWTPDGARRLAEKTQRYTSPAFVTDENGHITELINVALVAMPSTHNAPALVAAAKRGCTPPELCKTVARSPRLQSLSKSMDPKHVQEALDAIEAGDQAKGLELLKAMIAAAAGAESAEPPSADGLSTSADPPAADPTSPDPAKQMAALARQVEILTAGQSATVVKLQAQVNALTAEKEATESVERAALVGELVKLGFETPATAWKGEPEKKLPCKRLCNEPIADLRDRVKTLSAAPRPAHLAPPVTSEAELTPAQEKHLAKMTPAQQATFKATLAKFRK